MSPQPSKQELISKIHLSPIKDKDDTNCLEISNQDTKEENQQPELKKIDNIVSSLKLKEIEPVRLVKNFSGYPTKIKRNLVSYHKR